MKIAYKIAACQMLLLAFIVANGLFAVYSSGKIRSSLGTIRTEVLAQEDKLGELRFAVSEILGHTKSFFLSGAVEEKQALENHYGEFEKLRSEFLQGIGAKKEAQATLERLRQEAGELKRQTAELEALLASVPDPVMQRTLLAQKLTSLGAVEKKMEEEFLVLRRTIAAVSARTMQEIDGAARGEAITAAVIAGFCAAAAAILSWLLTRSIAPPLRQAVSMMQSLERGEVGRRLNLRRKDEIGEMGRAMDAFAESLEEEVVASMQKLAAGDLTFDVSPRGEDDRLRTAIRQVGVELQVILRETQGVAGEIAAGSGQVADSSQSLSQGATEQASSLEEIAASMHELASQTKLNAANAAQASQLSAGARQSAEEGNRRMQAMVSAMTEINEAGQSISKIIKTIDEIAFQTNLLALNAAVEAARAGQHGKGFAVVAEEVRNLAARSAKAARETAELIEGSVGKTENGARIARQTAGALQEIVSAVAKSSDLVGEIAAASNEQAEGISQINLGLSQIDQVTQQNTANAEQSAAAAEELSSQANHLTAMLRRFRLREGGETRPLPGGRERGLLR